MKKKKLVCLLLCLLLSFHLTAVSFASSTPEHSDQVKIVLENGTQLTVDRINQERPSDGLTVYTAVYDSFTPSFGEGTVEYMISDNTLIEINIKGEHGTYIPKNGFVISAAGSAGSSLAGLNIGESVQLIGMSVPILPKQYVKIGDVVVPVDNVDGFRSTAAAVVYTPSFGSSTNTNVWGMEITVSNGTVTQMGTFTGNSPIPSDGYVLSIHIDSSYIPLLQEKASVGMPAKLSLNDTPLYEAAKTSFDTLNPKSKEDNPGGWDDALNMPYPGMRGADQLIIYDSTYGLSTGTNPWGYEVSVDENGKVTGLGGNNSTIPAGGAVLSGHGIKAEWLQKHVRIGATVKWRADKKELILLYTPQSYIDKARLNISSVEQGLLESKSKFLDVPYSVIQQKIEDAQIKYEQLKNETDEGNFSQLFQTTNEIEALMSEAYYTNFESRKVEHRGLWVRPLETTAEQVKQHVAQIHEANLNTIYLETWWDGYTIFPTESTVTRQNPIYQGFDVLRAYLDEAQKYNIEVHSWVENFFVGPELLEKKPEWSIRSRQGYNYETVDGYRFYWMNPALPEARDFVAGVYRELIQNYEIQGLHLDYSRYPESGDYTNDFGYDTYTRGLFQEQYGIDPIDLHPGDDKWDEWVDMRVNFINTFVYRIVNEAKALRPDIKISAAVWADFERAPEYKLQDAKDWVGKNLIDHMLPMSYSFGVDSVVADAVKAQTIAGDKAYVVIGLGPYMRIDKRVFAGQVEGTRRLGIGGSAMFEFIGFFANRYDKELKLGLYRDGAIIPDRDPTKSLEVLFNEMKRKIAEMYIPNQGMNDDAKYEKELDTVLNILRPGKLNSGKANALLVQLNGLKESISQDTQLHAEVKNRMIYDVEYAIHIIDIFVSKSNPEQE